MNIDINDIIYKAHCPVTGRIGNINFNNGLIITTPSSSSSSSSSSSFGIPCLFSENDNPKRKTKYTIEAISLDSSKKKSKKWIGINQTKSNYYIEQFILHNSLINMIDYNKYEDSLKREVKIGKSKLDFKVGDIYLEIKTPLILMETNHIPLSRQLEILDNSNENNEKKFNSFDRLIKHFNELKDSLNVNERAIIVLVYMYNAKPFVPPDQNESNKKILEAAKLAREKGVETWQINLKFTSKGVSLSDYFQLNM